MTPCPPRRPRRRPALLLAAAGLLLLCALPAAAQDPPNLLNFAADLDGHIDRLITLSDANARIHELGGDLWRSLAVIIIVWTGLRIAFSGGFQPWEFVKLVMALWFPWVILRFYHVPLPPPANIPFPQMIAEGGNWIAGLFSADAVIGALGKLVDLVEETFNNALTGWQGFGFSVIGDGAQTFFNLALGTILTAIFVLAMIFVVALALAQVLFATIAVAVLTAIGPVFVPFMIVPQINFLFWGWLKALLQFSLYSAIAAIVLNLWSSIITTYIERFGDADHSITQPLLIAVWLIPTFLIVLCALISILKIGDIAAMIVGGGNDGGGVFGGLFLATRIVAAPARVVAGPAKSAVAAKTGLPV